MDQPLWLRKTSHIVNQNSTTILTGVAIAGVVTTAILAARATPHYLNARQVETENKADRIATEAGVAKNQDTWNKAWHAGLTPFEKFQIAWRPYLPAALTGAATVACIIGINQIGLRRNAALAGAYAIAETGFREYKEEVIKQLGAAKERGVTDEVAKKEVNEHPIADQQVIFTGGGDVLCFDRFTGRYFHSDHERIRRCENDFNANVLGGDMYGSLNDFYALLGLGDTTVGDQMGFNCENLLKLVFTSVLNPDTGEPCLAIGFETLPRLDYSSF
jgi:hypothetical protein